MKLCVICARAGSKGLPGKNLLKISGISLVERAIQTALDSNSFDKVAISTDGTDILSSVKHMPVELISRPKNLATDKASVFSALEHARNFVQEKFSTEVQGIGLIQPTSPLLKKVHITEALKKVESKKFKSVFTVKESKANPYFNLIEQNKDHEWVLCKNQNITRRQEAPTVYQINGAFYYWKITPRVNVENLKVVQKSSTVYPMSEIDSIDIDTKNDFDLAVSLFNLRNQ